MKKILIKLTVWSSILLILVAAIIVFLNYYYMPQLVDVPEVEVPNIIGEMRENAITILTSQKLIPVKQGVKYDSNVEMDRIILQKPDGGKKVKEGRHIYYWVSGGDPLIKVPKVIGKTIRDATVTLERLDFVITNIIETRSEFPNNTVISQSIEAGETFPKGSEIELEVSVGPRLGMVRVPALIAKSYSQAKKILRKNNLRMGKIIYQVSNKLLPNTVIDQMPSEDVLINVGETVDLVITKSK